MAENVQEISDVGAKPKKTAKMMNWTPTMSAFMMKCLAEIVAKGVKSDKGFKEIHLIQVAKSLSDFLGIEVTSIQVHNHLRKWRNRWQKNTQLRGLSGALWNDEKNMIVLEEQHYLGYTQDHPKDVEFLNAPLDNYAYMELCFGDKLATGKFAMGSSKPLRKPIDVEGQGTSGSNDPSLSSARKRKRTSVLSKEDSIQCYNMSDDVHEIVSAINNT